MRISAITPPVIHTVHKPLDRTLFFTPNIFFSYKVKITELISTFKNIHSEFSFFDTASDVVENQASVDVIIEQL